MATPEEIARKEEERLLKAFERSARGQAGKPAPVVKPKTIAEAPKPKPNPRPTSTPTNSGSIPTRPPTTTTVSKPAPFVQDKQPSLSATLSSSGNTISPRTVESAAKPVERPPKKKKDPAEKAAKREWRMKNKKWTIDDLMRVSEEALQGKHKAPHQGSHDEGNEDWKRGAETVDNLLQQRQAKEHEKEILEQEAFAKAQKEAKEKKKKDESPRDPLKEQEELEKLLSLSFLPVEEEPYTPPSYHKESSHREAEKVKDTTKELDELDLLMNIPLPEVPSYTPTSYEHKSSSTSSFSTYSAPPPKTYEPLVPLSKTPSSAGDLDNLSADLSELDNLIHSFQNETGSIAHERQQQQREAEERKRRERERELEEQRRKEDAKRRAAEEKQHSLKQWEEERNKVKAAEDLLRQRNEAEKVAQSQAIESQANGKKEVAAAGKILIQTLDDFEQGNYGRDRAVAFVSAIQKINDSVPLVFPPLRSDDVARNIVESTMKELIAMGTEMVILVKKNPLSELDRAEVLALRLAIRGRLAVVLKEVQKATEVVAVVYDEKKIDEILSFKSTPVVTPSVSSSSVGLSLIDFKRKAAALGNKAGQVLEKQDLDVPELSEVLTQIEATFPEFTDLGPVLTDQHAKKRYTEASLHVNSLGRKMLRDPLDFPVRMQLVQAVLAWLQALGHLA